MAVRALNESERDAALATLNGWSYDADARGIRRIFRFADFAEAFAFMTRVAILADAPCILHPGGGGSSRGCGVPVRCPL